MLAIVRNLMLTQGNAEVMLSLLRQQNASNLMPVGKQLFQHAGCKLTCGTGEENASRQKDKNSEKNRAGLNFILFWLLSLFYLLTKWKLEVKKLANLFVVSSW